MKRMLFAVALCAALGMVTFYAQAPAGGQKPVSADPYANNPDAGKVEVPAGRSGRERQRRQREAASRRRQYRLHRPGNVEIRHEAPRRRRAPRSGIR